MLTGRVTLPRLMGPNGGRDSDPRDTLYELLEVLANVVALPVGVYVTWISDAAEWLLRTVFVQRPRNIPEVYQETEEKIEKAQENFEEAVDALDRLRTHIETEGRRLESLMAELQEKKKEREVTEELLEQDQEALKKSLGLRSAQVYGFIGGVIASVVGYYIVTWLIPLASEALSGF